MFFITELKSFAGYMIFPPLLSRRLSSQLSAHMCDIIDEKCSTNKVSSHFDEEDDAFVHSFYV